MLDLDTTGRLLIPKDLSVFSKISKNVVVASAGSYIEIWDKDAYEKAIDDSTGDFSSLAEEVMGGGRDELS